jgi:putative pyruvate formate lyase activating enzyme
MGEEPLLGGSRGVGNIFFGNCNAACVYCQNHEISQRPLEESSREVTTERLAEIMLELAGKGAASIGLVSPSHFAAQAVEAINSAAARGLALPLIYNSNAYDSVATLRLLEGVFDIYLSDLRYASADKALAYSALPSYPRIARRAIQEMSRQVGSRLVLGDDGLIKRGLVIRLLVLPNRVSGTEESLRWIASELGASVTISVMAQYYPAYRAGEHPELARGVSRWEYDRVLELVEDLGFSHGWVQEYDSGAHYRPDFSDRLRPFGL